MNLQGLCIGNIDGKNDGDKGSLYLDQLNGLPVINASQDFNKAADIWLPYASACMPYDALATLYFATASRAGQALCESFTFPFTHSDAPNYNMHHSILNHITPTDTQVHHQVMPALANDAYLIGEMHEADNGGRGYLKIYLNPSTVNGELTGTLYGGASIHYYQDSYCYIINNSFCIPLAAGTAWAFEYQATNPKITLNLIAFELDTQNNFGSGSSVVLNTQFTATQDGLLHGFVSMQNDGDRSTIKLVNGAGTQTGQYNGVASASQHQYAASDIYVPINTATIPIKNGDFYIVEAQATAGNPEIQAYFTPATLF